MLFQQNDYHALIVPPDRVVPANPIIVGQEYADDITASWHIIADDGNGDYLTIDLHPERLGRCYDSFHETHGLVGDCPVIVSQWTGSLLRSAPTMGSHRKAGANRLKAARTPRVSRRSAKLFEEWKGQHIRR